MRIFHHSKQSFRGYVLGLAAIVLVFFATPTALAQTQECPEGSVTRVQKFTAGVKDSFRLPADATKPSARLIEQLGRTWNNFDDAKEPKPLGHTFTDLPCYIVGATLTAHITPIGKPKENDYISLGLQEGRFLWTGLIKDLAERWPTRTTITLDLNKLPTRRGFTSILSHLAQGTLDVYFSSHVAVDYLELTITYCEFEDCNNNCIPDKIDIGKGTSRDDNRNGIPDECEDDPEPASIQVLCDSYLSVGLGTDCCAWLVLAPDVITTGNVGNYTVTNDFNGATGDLVTACFPIGVTQVTFIATTESGLTAQCTTVIHVFDNGAPVITPQ